ncbi:hypothetical protein EYF80_024244 [Liparis tanakae]|uniref:Uncharacterized protein n=1 Tax=Liparis tanakae TaxID=230148 RepID=A0A4Z2HIE3_9TELE|nr:hypothetical protein EYF80_024244 [Liparis tanakae]
MHIKAGFNVPPSSSPPLPVHPTPLPSHRQPARGAFRAPPRIPWGRSDHVGLRLQSPLRILSDAPKFRAECLQTLRDGEVEEESAAPPSIDATITTPLVHDFIICLTGEFGPQFGRTLRLQQRMGIGTQAKACHFG